MTFQSSQVAWQCQLTLAPPLRGLLVIPGGIPLRGFGEPVGFRKPATRTCENPCLWMWVQVLMGTGTGYTGKPQGSLCHSLGLMGIPKQWESSTEPWT